MQPKQIEQFTDYYKAVCLVDRQNDVQANMSKYEQMRIAVELMRLFKADTATQIGIDMMNEAKKMFDEQKADMAPGSLMGEVVFGAGVPSLDEDFLIEVGRLCNLVVQYDFDTDGKLHKYNSDFVSLAKRLLDYLSKK